MANKKSFTSRRKQIFKTLFGSKYPVKLQGFMYWILMPFAIVGLIVPFIMISRMNDTRVVGENEKVVDGIVTSTRFHLPGKTGNATPGKHLLGEFVNPDTIGCNNFEVGEYTGFIFDSGARVGDVIELTVTANRSEAEEVCAFTDGFIFAKTDSPVLSKNIAIASLVSMFLFVGLFSAVTLLGELTGGIGTKNAKLFKSKSIAGKSYLIIVILTKIILLSGLALFILSYF